MKIGIVFFLLIVCLMTGCETSSRDFVFSAGGDGQASDVVGRVYLGDDVAGANFRLFDLQGNQLAEGVTNSNGHVVFRGLRLPPDFRAVASLEGSGVSLTAELRGFDPQDRQVHVSLLSTLAAELMSARPEMSLPQAEDAVKQALSLPTELDLGISLEEPNPVFSSLALLREAGERGGWSAFKQELLSRAEAVAQGNSQPTFFLLSLEEIARPLQGLEPGLAEEAEAIRLEMADRYRVDLRNQPPLTGRFGPPLVFLAGPTSLGGQFLLGVGTGIAGNLVSAVTKGLLGWAANQLGLNYGTSGQLEEISEQLTGIENAVNQLTTEITDNDILAKITSLETEFDPIMDVSVVGSTVQDTGGTGSLVTAIGGRLNTLGETPLNTPATISISSLVSTLNAPDYESILDDAEQQLVGANGIIQGVQQIVTNQQLGLDRPSSAMGFALRSNPILDRVLPVFQKFSNLQTATLNLYSEQAHNYLIYPNPVDGINDITAKLRANIAAQKQQRQQLPFRNGLENSVVDSEFGIMWYSKVLMPDTYDNAKSITQTKTEQVVLPDSSMVTYDDWRLPTFGEYQALQARGTYNPTYSQTDDLDRDGQSQSLNGIDDPDDNVPVHTNEPYPDTGQSTAGLPALGFQDVAKALNASDGSSGSNGDLWMTYIELQYQVFTFDYYEFRLNYLNDNIEKASGINDKKCYMACRTFGPDVLVTPFVGDDPGQGEYRLGVTGKAFLDGECALYGVPTAISFANPPIASSPVTYPTSSDGGIETFTPPPGSMQFYVAVTYQIQVGGEFTLGYGSGATKTMSLVSKTSSGEVGSQFQRAGTKYNAVREMINWSVANTNPADPVEHVRMLNLPYVGGIATPLDSIPVIVNATLLGQGGSPVTGSYNYTPAPAARTLQSLQISPRNQIYGSNLAQPATGNYPYQCTGFYSDGTVESLAGKVTWTVTPSSNAAGAQMVSNGDGVSLALAQPAQAQPVVYDLRVTATLGAISDTTTIQIEPPVAAP